jgi:hypothetical protein
MTPARYSQNTPVRTRRQTQPSWPGQDRPQAPNGETKWTAGRRPAADQRPSPTGAVVANDFGRRSTVVVRGTYRECRPVTPEAAGSSPVDPANYLQFKYFYSSAKLTDLRPQKPEAVTIRRPPYEILRECDFRPRQTLRIPLYQSRLDG